MFDFLHRWRHVNDAEDKNIVRLLVITRDDRFSTSVQAAARACGWEIQHVGTIESGLDVLREFPASVAIYDWWAAEDDWRLDMDRLSAGGDIRASFWPPRWMTISSRGVGAAWRF